MYEDIAEVVHLPPRDFGVRLAELHTGLFWMLHR